MAKYSHGYHSGVSGLKFVKVIIMHSLIHLLAKDFLSFMIQLSVPQFGLLLVAQEFTFLTQLSVPHLKPLLVEGLTCLIQLFVPHLRSRLVGQGLTYLSI